MTDRPGVAPHIHPVPDALVRPAEEKDLRNVGMLNASAFRGNSDDIEAAMANLEPIISSRPGSFFAYIIEVDGEVAGYITWMQEGGLVRPEPAIELLQLVIDKKHKGKGLAGKLLLESLTAVLEWVRTENSRLTDKVLLFVWTYCNNFPAIKVYNRYFHRGLGSRNIYGTMEICLGWDLPINRDEPVQLPENWGNIDDIGAWTR